MSGFKRKLDTPTLEAAWDAAIEAGVGSPDTMESAAGLTRLLNEKPEHFERLDDWRGGAFSRVLNAYDNGAEHSEEDAAVLTEFHRMAIEAAKLKG